MGFTWDNLIISYVVEKTLSEAILTSEWAFERVMGLLSKSILLESLQIIVCLSLQNFPVKTERCRQRKWGYVASDYGASGFWFLLYLKEKNNGKS
jgi:hypothetical protein